jgi:hypothetical protein
MLILAGNLAVVTAVAFGDINNKCLHYYLSSLL